MLLTLGSWMTIKGSDGLTKFFRKDSEVTGSESARIVGEHDESRSKPKRSREDIQRLAEQWYQEILEKHPEMKVSFKEVPDERNGFLQFLNFMERFGKWGSDGLPFPENISAMLNGTAAWDASAMAKWLEENRQLVDEIKAIGLLEEQSVKGIDMQRTMFFSGRLANECSWLLLADARLAMESGDPDAVVEAHLRYFSSLVEQMKTAELAELPGLSANPPDKTGVSQNGADILDTLFVGASAWSKGWTRSQTDKALYQAALLAATGGELPLEPYTGMPFVIDHDAGTVSLPEDPWLESLNYEPVKIPTLKQP